MKKTIAILFILATIIFAGCQQTTINNPTHSNNDDDTITVLVSVLPQKAFVRAVGKDAVKVQALIPPGSSPATYDPTPQDLVAVEQAQLYFRIGHIPFEKTHMNTLTQLNPSMKIIDTSEHVTLRYFGEDHHENDEEENENHKEHHDEDSQEDENHEEHEDQEQHFEEHDEEHTHAGVDPHIWLSPQQVKIQVDSIATALSKQDPKNAQNYSENAEEFKKKLDEVHEEIQTMFSELKTNTFMVFHPSWGYFADDFGLEQIAIEQSGKEPTAQELQNIISQAKEEHIKVIFVQSQFNKEIAKSIAEEIDAVIVSIDPLSPDYIANLRTVATTIAQHLNAQ